MLKKFFLSVALNCFFLGSLNALPLLKIDNHNAVTDYAGKEIVLIKKGDNPSYKLTSFDDSTWKKISLPSNWNTIFPDWKGVCWYRLHIRLPESDASVKSLGLLLGIIVDVDEVYFNGKLIGASGQFPPDRKSCYDYKRIYSIPEKLVKTGVDNVLAIRVHGLFSDVNGPYAGIFKIGPYYKIQRIYFLNEFINIIFVIIYLSISIFFCIFFIRFNHYKEYFFFSLFVFLAGLYLFFQAQLKYLFWNNFLVLKRLEYLILILIFVVFFEFITYYLKKNHGIIHRVFHSISLVCFIFIVLSDNFQIWNNLLKYCIEPSWVLPISFFFYFFIKEIKGNRETLYFFISFLILLVSLINDVLVNRDLINSIYLTNFSVIFVIVSFSISLYKRFRELYQQKRKPENNLSQSSPLKTDVIVKLEKALEIVRENYSMNISRKEIAESIGMNTDNLGKLFKRYYGRTITEYRNEFRIKEAVRLIKTTDHSIIDIAYTVGFESISTFYRVFQKIEGASPKSLRDGAEEDK